MGDGRKRTRKEKREEIKTCANHYGAKVSPVRDSWRGSEEKHTCNLHDSSEVVLSYAAIMTRNLLVASPRLMSNSFAELNQLRPRKSGKGINIVEVY